MTVAVFVNPGDHPEYVEHRSLEYDTVSDRYVTFLVSLLLLLLLLLLLRHLT